VREQHTRQAAQAVAMPLPLLIFGASGVAAMYDKLRSKDEESGLRESEEIKMNALGRNNW
jgi:hypothetical protein